MKNNLSEQIHKKYFETLLEREEDCQYSNDIGNGQVEFHFKDEYLDESVENMIDYVWDLETRKGQKMLELAKQKGLI